jgi:Xaa-Pro aminopeptidase
LPQNFGGVRLEDDLLVTETGHENLTKCPRTIEEVEAVMQKARDSKLN